MVLEGAMQDAKREKQPIVLASYGPFKPQQQPNVSTVALSSCR